MYIIAYMCHSNSHFSVYAGASFYYLARSFQETNAASQKPRHQDVQHFFERCLSNTFIVRDC